MLSREGRAVSHQQSTVILPTTILLAANSVAVCALFAASHLDLPDWLFRTASCWPGVALAQGTMLAAVAALARVRYCLRVPLLIAGILSQSGSIILVAVLTENSTPYYPYAFLCLVALLTTILFVLYIPLRCLLAVRLDVPGDPPSLSPLQFSIGDLLEWSTALAILLGAFRWLPANSSEGLQIPATIAVDGVLALAYSLSVVSLLLSARSSSIRNVSVVFWLSFVAVIHLGWIRMSRTGNVPSQLWVEGLLPDAVFIATLGANSVVMRWLGFRFHWGQRQTRLESPPLQSLSKTRKTPSVPVLIPHRQSQ